MNYGSSAFQEKDSPGATEGSESLFLRPWENGAYEVNLTKITFKLRSPLPQWALKLLHFAVWCCSGTCLLHHNLTPEQNSYHKPSSKLKQVSSCIL